MLNTLNEESETQGLLALMLFHDARKPARVNAAGEYRSLEEQERSLWVMEKVNRGDKILKGALKKGNIGVFQIQAAISGIHSKASSFDKTNWQEILLLYCRLYSIKPSAVIKLNSLVALSHVHGPDLALHKLNAINEHKLLDNYQPYYATKADLLRRLNRFPEAKLCYIQAIKLSTNDIERNFLENRLSEVKKNNPCLNIIVIKHIPVCERRKTY